MSTSTIIRRLREVIAALDRRQPQPLREDEEAISQQSAALRRRAENRIAELEGGPDPL
jgi:hypothetical protein